MADNHIWHYRGRRLKRLEWGLWRDLDDSTRFFLCYRPQGRSGPQVRRWARTGPGVSLDDLKTHVRRARAAIQARKLAQPVRLPPTLAIDQYIAELERRGRADGHTSDVERALERFTAFVGKSMHLVTPADVEHFLGALATDGHGARSQNKHRGHLRAWFVWALRHRLVDINPVDQIEVARETAPLIKVPEPEALQSFLKDAPEREAALWTLFLLTGLRRGSILSLDADCFTDDGVIVRHTKEGRQRFLAWSDGCPLWGQEVSALGRRLFSEPVTMWFLRRAAARVAKAGGGFTPHTLRHCFCSYLVMMGEHMTDVSAWAGHSSVMTTEKWYSHLRPNGLRRAAQHRTRVFTLRSHALSAAGVSNAATHVSKRA